MSVPHVVSTTIGLNLPSFTIHRELEGVAQKKQIRSAVVAKAPVARSTSPRMSRVSAFIPAVLVIANLALFFFYLYSVNHLQALSYNANQAQKELEVLRDEQRQWQVQIADASSGVRMREVSVGKGDFVSVGTPEFLTAHSPTTLTMR